MVGEQQLKDAIEQYLDLNQGFDSLADVYQHIGDICREIIRLLIMTGSNISFALARSSIAFPGNAGNGIADLLEKMQWYSKRL